MKIKSKNINLRLVNINDAETIIKLRKKNGKYLSKTNFNVADQVNWISKYKTREMQKKEFYFIIENKNKIQIGTIRIYNINYLKKIFTFGSFIVDSKLNKFRYCALEAITEIFYFAFNVLKLDICYFDCRKENKNANNFYIKFGAKMVSEDDFDFFYEYNKSFFMENITAYRHTYS